MIEVEVELQPFAAAVEQALARLRVVRAKAVGAGSLDYGQIEEEMAASTATAAPATAHSA
ncbi:MAG: hypothetical protein EXR72_05155 [Myxococcales bacterium]|nr:hypothetical protein [Myxococcales bacterium]